MNNLFLNALAGKNKSGTVPVWLMRQAGRYLVEYQALRKRYDFMELIHSSDLIVSITKLPVDLFDFDAAIVFSDILLIAELLGATLWFEEGSGPHIEPVLSTPRDILRLQNRDLDFPFLTRAIKTLKNELTVPLIGFAGAPFTVASYMIEGRSSQKLRKTKKWLLEDPDSFYTLLDVLCEYTIAYLKEQIKAGVDAVQIFDTWAEKLAWGQFQQASAKYIKRIVDAITEVPVIVFCRGSSALAADLAALKPAAISFDWQSDLSKMRAVVGPDIALQGNLDPEILLTNPQTVRREVTALRQRMKNDPGYIFNLGHGILPETPRENVEALVACLKN